MKQPVQKLIEQQTDEELSLTEKWAESLPASPREEYLSRISAERYKRFHKNHDCVPIQVEYVDEFGKTRYRKSCEPKEVARAREEFNLKVASVVDGTTKLFHKERIAILQVAIEKNGLTEELFEAYAKEMIVERGTL